MAKFLYKMGTFIAKHKWSALIAWIVIVAAIFIPITTNAPKFDNDIKMTGLKSLDTNDKIEKHFNQDSEKAQIRVVFKTTKDDGIVQPNITKDIKKTLNNIKKDDKHIDKISDPYENKQISKDKTTAFADITYDVNQTSLKDDSRDNVKSHLKDLRDNHNVQTELTGTGMTSTDVGGNSELVGIIVAFVVLLITFGSVIAAGLPIISALIGLASGVGIISLLTYAFDIPNVTLTLAVMIGLAVGIDYALFILFRYRQVMKTETDHIKGIGLAVGTAGSAVIFAGVTVVIAVCGLSLVGIDFLAVMGFASAISVIFAVISALTLLPALISIFHKRIKVNKLQSKFKKDIDTPWSKFITGNALAAVLLGLIILVAAAIPVSHMRLGIPDDGVKPADSTQKKAYDIISDKFGEGFNGQIPMLINVKDKKDDPQGLQQDLQSVYKDIKDKKNVDIVTPPQMSKDNEYALMVVIPKHGPNAESTNDLVHDLRDYNKDAQDKYGFKTEISGQSVINIDMSKKLNEAIPLFASVIVVLAFFLLMIVFRSILIPLKAVLGFVLSLLATLGFTTLVMQDGFMKGLFGIETTGPMLAFLPVITIGILFGLAMDYEVFLMSRIHEEYSKTGDNDYAIKVGLKESGPVIVAAALIMFSVFFAFVFQEDVMIKSMGMALAFGVLFDAFIVRMMLIPALTKLFGKGSWYLPAWLNRIIPRVDIEGHALEKYKTVESQTSEVENSKEKYDTTFKVHEQDTHVAKGSQLRDETQTIVLDNRTMALYQQVKQHSANPMFLHDALVDYQNKHHLNTQQQTTNIDQLNKNIEKLNQLLEQNLRDKS
ncbi:fatty acid efflux MMPL transporter FarE [Staphylococcus argenteus]|uniref:fatty acid efflux MMPL transporter FarE n=1 Tax=Staphylococcus argenteus TaxID=985002 RepID=UPI00090F6678|nr:fatty acid efflux MMPL transporter FarE [Staphylococcus argenteus]MCG9854756.1 fatty acid efflux MMPL transporter FarE [Staphylococcus argenteus]SGW88196.1 Putative antibiotic transport-associated protein [Staphylococcus argenteus]SGX52486.1 Putative antibiotic transport-associated protein [Staphylococcus argenteus]SHD25681.1 Putative antibiotic transport-associated protein [Staphylococcus argenteus]GJF49231.1 fatty acid efflux MMPL transporter FarE [Staphylococcus argenteus]